MKTLTAFSAGFVLAGGLSIAIAQSAMPPALFVAAGDIAAGIEESAGDRANMQVGRITNTDDWRINMIHRTAAAGAIVHERGTEIHYITDGEGTLVTGGVVVSDAAGNRMVEGGEARVVRAGDFVLVPDGTPHWYSEVEESVTYLEVRFYPND